MRRRPGLYLFLFLTPVLWGATFPASKIGLEAIGILPFMAWTRVLGFVTILVAVLLLARDQVTARAVRAVVGPGLLLGALIFVAYVVQTAGLARTTATNAGFITGLYVVFTPLLGLLLFRRAVGRAAWAAVAISVTGMALLSVPGLGDLRPRTGDLLVLASAAVWAGQAVALGYYADRHPSLLLSLAQMGGTALLHVGAVAAVGLRPAEALHNWGVLVVTGVIGSGIAYTLQVIVLREITPTRAVVVLAGESVAAAAISFAWLGERLEPHQWAGAALVLVAMTVSEAGARRADQQAEAAVPV